MWHWDQGRLEYFQFDVLRSVSQFCLHNDFASASRETLKSATGLAFDPTNYQPWRNYSRVFKSMFIISGTNTGAMPTAIAARLAIPGQVTSDEYFHFLAQATTEPSPALSTYNSAAVPRYPLLFAIKYLLTKAAISDFARASYDEIIGAYRVSNFIADEGQSDFLTLMNREPEFISAGVTAPDNLRRQARESLRVISQISYLHIRNSSVEVSLACDDARDAFNELAPIGGSRRTDGNDEIQRRADLFRDGSTLDFFDYPRTVVSEIVQAGFEEGGRVEKTHLVIERNSKLRKEYFIQFDPKDCDICQLDTRASYPWTTSVLDIHHKLPLASGTRVEAAGTALSDLVPLCPTCHRAVHRFYGIWLKDAGQRDFSNAQEAYGVYEIMKENFPGHRYAS